MYYLQFIVDTQTSIYFQIPQQMSVVNIFFSFYDMYVQFMTTDIICFVLHLIIKLYIVSGTTIFISFAFVYNSQLQMNSIVCVHEGYETKYIHSFM